MMRWYIINFQNKSEKWIIQCKLFVVFYSLPHTIFYIFYKNYLNQTIKHPYPHGNGARYHNHKLFLQHILLCHKFIYLIMELGVHFNENQRQHLPCTSAQGSQCFGDQLPPRNTQNLCCWLSITRPLIFGLQEFSWNSRIKLWMAHKICILCSEDVGL
jgi:hypothetical protein